MKFQFILFEKNSANYFNLNIIFVFSFVWYCCGWWFFFVPRLWYANKIYSHCKNMHVEWYVNKITVNRCIVCCVSSQCTYAYSICREKHKWKYEVSSSSLPYYVVFIFIKYIYVYILMCFVLYIVLFIWINIVRVKCPCKYNIHK